MPLPPSLQVPVEKLASVFRSTSATYKFYWFLALLEMVEEGATHIPKKTLFAKMISTYSYSVA